MYHEFVYDKGKNIDIEVKRYTKVILYKKIEKHKNIVDNSLLQCMISASFLCALKITKQECVSFEEMSKYTDDSSTPEQMLAMVKDMSKLRIIPKIDKLYKHLIKVLDLENTKLIEL